MKPVICCYDCKITKERRMSKCEVIIIIFYLCILNNNTVIYKIKGKWMYKLRFYDIYLTFMPFEQVKYLKGRKGWTFAIE